MSMKINADAIRTLAELLDENGLTEIEISEEGKSIRVNRSGGTAVPVTVSGVAAPQMTSDPTVPQPANASAPDTVAQDHPGAVTSPMVGTVYLAAEPGAPQFISKGASVSEGDTLMIIEAMKVMNPIKAPRSGTIATIAVENAMPVEFGDVLVIIE